MTFIFNAGISPGRSGLVIDWAGFPGGGRALMRVDRSHLPSVDLLIPGGVGFDYLVQGLGKSIPAPVEFLDRLGFFSEEAESTLSSSKSSPTGGTRSEV